MNGPLQVRTLYSAEQVEARIEQLADSIWADCGQSLPEVISIAEGAVRFTQALCEALARRGGRPRIQTVRARRTSGMQLASLQIEALDLLDVMGRDVLLVDDIADEGRTLRAVSELLEEAECRSIRTAVLVSKQERRVESIRLDYVGFEVERGWVVGFGMDVDGELRDLDEIGVIEASRET